jgi:hypothetical protein
MRSLSSLASTGNMAFYDPAVGAYASDPASWYVRRKYDLKDSVIEIAPSQTPFLTVLSKFRKIPTTDPMFRFFEHESRWYRQMEGSIDASAFQSYASSFTAGATISVDEWGGNWTFAGGGSIADNIEPNRVVRFVWTADDLTSGIMFLLAKTPSDLGAGWLYVGGDTPPTGANFTATFTMIGSGYEWGGGRASGISDDLTIKYGKTQIFKTAYSVDNTLRHTTLYGGNELLRLRAEKAMEHKADIERSMLFGTEESGTMSLNGKTIQFSKGLYTELSNSSEAIQEAFSYNGTTYADFVDLAQDVFEFGSQSKLFMVSRKVLSWFSKNTDAATSKLTGGFVPVGSTQPTTYGLSTGQSAYGLNIQKLITPHGDLNVVVNPMLRGDFEDIAFVLDMNHLAYRVLQGRDTTLETNVEDKGTDGVIDQYLTEAGLQIENLNAHAVINFG